MIYKIYNDHYVAAIIKNTSCMAKWLLGCSPADHLKVEPVHCTEYPFMLSEFEKNGKRIFLASSEEETKDLQNMMKGLCKLLATYRIEKDFLGDPDQPGHDYMGILPHDHPEETMIPVDCLSDKDDD